ncbi:MAG: non-ribosomal peptide synthetase, partial [Blastocatellia bacterium]
SYPAERLRYMVEDSGVRVVLAEDGTEGMMGASGVRVINVWREREEIAKRSNEEVSSGLVMDNLAYVIYTSGSTGLPKGVAMSYGPLFNMIMWQTQDSTPRRGARTLQFTTFSFDVSFQEIFSTLCSGGTLVLIKDEDRRDVERLLQCISDANVDRIFLPFVALQQLAEVYASNQSLPINLREVITAGEQLHITPHIINLFNRLEDCMLHNHYGPTETHAATELKLSGPPESWPLLPAIGRPLGNTMNYVLDSDLRPTPIGVPGELYIGGVSLARGYLNRPDLTAERFIPDVFSSEPGMRLYKTGDRVRYQANGDIQFLGRVDHQVKIRGFRIELGEIEGLLNQHPAVEEAAVVASEHKPGIKRLVAYLVANKGATLSAGELRSFIRQKLPDYMVPSAFVMLDAMPLTLSGKINRRALPAPDRTRSEQVEDFAAPRTQTEKALADIWAEMLAVDKVGIYENFFDMGGHSLLGTRLIARIRDEIHVELPLRVVFEAPTIAEQALAIMERYLEREDKSETDRLLTELEQLSDDDVFAMLAKAGPVELPA